MIASPVARLLAGRRRVRIAIVLAAIFLVVVGLWTGHAVRKGIDQSLRSALETVLQADVTALELWVENECSFVHSIASDRDFRDDVAALLSLAEGGSVSRESLLASPAQRDLRERFEDPLEDDLWGFVLTDPTGLVLASSIEEFVGERARPGELARVAPALNGEVILTKPYVPRAPANEPGVFARRMASAAPVVAADGTVGALLVLLIDPEKDFTRILSVARIGETGETYAFDERGVLISESRFDEQLKTAGVIPDEAEARSSLVVELRDPGGDLTRGYQPELARAAMPFTHAVASALGDESGMDLDGYRDYRGVRVVGAWRWLPDYEIGIVTEVDETEAFAPLRPLRLAVRGLLALIALVTIAVLVSSHVIQRLSRQIAEVRQLGQYTLDRKIGEGGMGEVYLARHAMLRRPTAVKLLRPELLTTENLARFEREVQLTSKLTHPNTIEIYDFGRTPEDIFYYAMEYLRGITLAKLIQIEGAVPPARVVHILKQVCGSLEEAHTIGLVHRDIKPANVMLCRRGVEADVAKVLDFGLVKDVVQPESIEVTAQNIVGGTPAYIAPERLKNPKRVDARVDLYALGVVAFNLLTGQELYTGDTPADVGYQALFADVPRPSERVDRAIPPALDDLVFACLSKDPDDRPADAGDMLRRLEAIGLDEPWTRDDARAWWDAHPELAPETALVDDPVLAPTVSAGTLEGG